MRGRGLAGQGRALSSASSLGKDEIAALAARCLAVTDGLQAQRLLGPQVGMTASFKVFGELLSGALGPVRYGDHLPAGPVSVHWR